MELRRERGVKIYVSTGRTHPKHEAEYSVLNAELGLSKSFQLALLTGLLVDPVGGVLHTYTVTSLHRTHYTTPKPLTLKALHNQCTIHHKTRHLSLNAKFTSE